MVAPLDIKTLIHAKSVHDKVSSWAAVEDIAKDVQLVDAQTLDHIAERNDKIVGLPRRDDGLYDATEIGVLVIVSRRFMKKFLDNIRLLLFQRFSYT